MGGYVKRKIVAPLREFMVFPRYILRGRPNGGVRPPLFPAKRLGKDNLVRGRLPRVRQPASCSITTPWQDSHSQYMHSTHPLLLSVYAIGADGTVAQKGV